MSAAAAGVGYAVYMLIRWLIKAAEQPHPAPIITPPPRPSPPAIITPPPSPPVVEWTEPRELLAWRSWRLGFLLLRAGGDGGHRLLSLTAECIWNGPVVQEREPQVSTITPSGIYALKLDVADRIQWQNEHCWVTGTIALSGRVVEHALGYRAERAVVRELRLGVGTHLAVRSLNQLRRLMECLEERYQVTVAVGHQEREIADRMLTDRESQVAPEIPFVWDRLPWRLI